MLSPINGSTGFHRRAAIPVQQHQGRTMKTIDIHAHIVPDSLWRAIAAGQGWHGYSHEAGEGLGTMIGCGGARTAFTSPKVKYTVEQRLQDMDAQKVDVQVLSIHTPLGGYHLEAEQGLALARDFNDEVGATVRENNQRLAGFATLPMQDVKRAIAELERAVMKLGLKGAALDTSVNGEQWDEPKFLPFLKAAEQMGALLFFHPQPQHNFLAQRTNRHGLVNSLGVILDDAIVTAVLICGGVLEKCPELKVCIAHGGGPACHAMGRLDRNWHDRPATRSTPKPPSAYQKQLYYDTVTGSEAALRFLIDQVGADRVVLGSDWPFVPWHPSPVTWVQNLETLSAAEKEKILWKNLAELLDIR
jgi:aminocarboxymuconate-semialdehyde decarboxylase